MYRVMEKEEITISVMIIARYVVTSIYLVFWGHFSPNGRPLQNHSYQ